MTGSGRCVAGILSLVGEGRRMCGLCLAHCGETNLSRLPMQTRVAPSLHTCGPLLLPSTSSPSLLLLLLLLLACCSLLFLQHHHPRSLVFPPCPHESLSALPLQAWPWPLSTPPWAPLPPVHSPHLPLKSPRSSSPSLPSLRGPGSYLRAPPPSTVTRQRPRRRRLEPPLPPHHFPKVSCAGSRMCQRFSKRCKQALGRLRSHPLSSRNHASVRDDGKTPASQATYSTPSPAPPNQILEGR